MAPPLREFLRPSALRWAWLPLILVGTPGSAQAPAGRALTVAPSLGFGVLRRNGDWESGGVEASLELGYGDARLRWLAQGSLRGVGVDCSDGCSDGGWGFSVGALRSVGRVWLGGGAGLADQFGDWQLQPQGRIVFDVGRVELQLRLEVPLEAGGVYLPILIGFRLPPTSR